MDGSDLGMAAAALDEDRIWPTTKSEPTDRYEPLDVDRYDDRAVVLGWSRGPSGGGLNANVFIRRNGRWEYRGGGGGGGAGLFKERWRIRRHESAPLDVQSKGWIFGGLSHATILCLPQVYTVTIERSQGLRHADVSQRPGWIAIVWPDGDEPLVRAFDASGVEVHSLAAESFVQQEPGMVPSRCPTCRNGWLLVPKELVAPMYELEPLPDGYETVCQPNRMGGRTRTNCGLRHRHVHGVGWLQDPRSSDS